MKTEVYSWRVSSEIKERLEREAKRRKTAVAALLIDASRRSLSQSGAEEADEAEQRRLHAAASRYVGKLEIGLGPYDNARVRTLVAEQVTKHQERPRVRRPA